MTKELLQQALDAIPTQAILHVSGLLVSLKVYKRDYVPHAKDEPLVKLSDALAAVTAIAQAATAVERERCANVCKSERVGKNDNEGDIAYNLAINHCVAAIRQGGDA